MARSNHGRGVLTILEDRQNILLLVTEAVASGCSQYRACDAFNLEERTLQRWQKNTTDGRRGPLTVPANKLTSVERDLVKKPYSWEEVDGDDDRLLPRVGRVSAHMKRWYLGTYHGGMKITEIQPYLDEFVFRYNRRTSKSRGLVFHRMVEAAVHSSPRPKLVPSSA